MYKLLVLVLFALFVGIASYILDEMGIRLPLQKLSAASETIQKDLKEIKATVSFPPELQQIHQVFVSDHRTQKSEIDWLHLSTQYFPQKKDGLYDLQIEVFDDGTPTPENSDNLMILQFSLFELKSRNKVWEMSRSYKHSDFPGPASNPSR